MKCMLGVQAIPVQPYKDTLSSDEWVLKHLENLRYPMLASPKLDGIRCLVIDGVPYTRDMKLIPNLYVREQIMQCLSLQKYTFDGELIAIDAQGKMLDFNSTQSAIMKQDGKPLFTYNIFEIANVASFSQVITKATALQRTQRLQTFFADAENKVPSFCKLVPQYVVETPQAVMAFEKQFLEEGYEGLMLKETNTQYKNGRSTLREQALLKVTRSAFNIATIKSVEPLMHNMNEAIISGAGKRKRSSAQENLIAQPILGSLVVDTEKWGEFSIGSFANWSKLEKIAFWAERDSLIDKKIIFRYKPFGSKDKPRHPIGCILLTSEEEACL